MPLEEYRRKRNFKKTPEPAGSPATSNGQLRYVIQKHAASRLHYDFRLELDGTLKSWAVPKGPSLDPADKRLAVHVEDHPIDYAGFEGTIPEQQYGAGHVIVWDKGVWAPAGDARQLFQQGRLKFKLDGEKLRGGWALVRMQGRESAGRENWLLIKERDDTAVPGYGDKLVIERPESVLTGRTLETLQASAAPDHDEGGERPSIKAKKRRLARAAPELKAVRKSAGASLDSMETSAERSADNRVAGITITHPEREVFPESQCSKLDVARYYVQMATYILPYVSNRPLSIVRCPRGARKTCFFQKHAEARAIPGVEIASIRDSGGLNPYILANSVEALVGLAQMGTIELHTWMATMPAVERPDTFIIDFDPDTGVAWSDVVKAARTARALLDDLGLVSFVKTTGGKGLHVVVPLARRHSWEDIKSFSRDLAMRLVQNEPDRYVAVASKAERKGKIFVDYLRNSRGATAVVPYSLRARAGATVATPIAWDTLTASLEPASLTLSAVLALVQTRPDPWADYLAVRQTITAKMKRALAAHS